MSLTSADGFGAKSPGGAAAGSAPRLTGAAAYSTWAPLFSNWLQRNGAEIAVEREIPNFAAKLAVAKDWVREAEEASWAAALGGGSSSSAVKSEDAQAATAAAETLAHRKEAIRLLDRSKRVYAALYEAMPEELRVQIPTTPGDAFALWLWLENKLQSKEADAVNSLLKQWHALHMGPEESFDAYRARVNKLRSFLATAGENVSHVSFLFVMTEKLQPHYSTVVLALKAGEKLQDPAAVDWDKVAAMMNSHERSELELNGGVSEERTMAAFGRQRGDRQQRHLPPATSASSSSHGSNDRRQPLPHHKDLVCDGCRQKGHIRRFCPTHGFEAQGQERQRGGRETAAAAMRGNTRRHADDDDQKGDSGEDRLYAFSSVAVRETPAPKGKFAQLAMGLRGLHMAAPASLVSARKPGALQKAASASPLPPPAVRLVKRLGRPDSEEVAAAPAGLSRSQVVETAAQAVPKESVNKMLAKHSWGVDTMASCHVSGNRGHFLSLKGCTPRSIQVADGTTIQCTQIGSVKMCATTVTGAEKNITVDEVLYSDRFAANLLSFMSLKTLGWEMHSSKDETFLLTPLKSKLPLLTRNRVSVLECNSLERVYGAVAMTKVLSTADEFLALHERLGHMSFDGLLEVLKSGATLDLPSLGMSAAELKKAKACCMDCPACVRAKGTKQALGKRGLDRGRDTIESLHADSFEVQVDDKRGYGLTVIDPFSAAQWFVRAESKDLLPQMLIDVIVGAQTQSSKKVKRLHTDGGSEFINSTVKRFCRENGTELHFSPAGTPQLNGIAERSVRKLKEGGRVLLEHAELHRKYWARAVAHFVYVWNRTKINPTTGMTPYEALRGEKPSARYLGVFGSDVAVFSRDKRQTFDAKTEPGVYLGHDDAQNCPVVLLLKTGKIVRSKDVRFPKQTKFSHAAALRGGPSAIDRAVATSPSLAECESELFEEETDDGTVGNASLPSGQTSSSTASGGVSDAKGESEQLFEIERIVGRKGTGSRLQYLVEWKGCPNQDTWEPAKSLQQQGCQESIDKYEQGQALADTDDEPEQPHPSVVHMVMNAIGREQQTGVEQRTFDPDIEAAVAAAIKRLETPTPETYSEAVKCNGADDWRKAMDKEMKSCEDAGTWKRVRRADLPADANVIPCKWVFKLKNDETGTVTEHKARLTPKGFRQKKGVDYDEVFARTGMYKTMRVGLALTAAWGHELDQMDVPSAFLNAPIKEELYMEMPEGYREEGMVFKLEKALYGLKQAPRNWYILVSTFLQLKDKAGKEQVQRAMNTLNEILHMGFTASVSDPCLFFRKTATGRLILIFLFVDDFQISYHANDREEWGALKKLLVDRFRTKDMGESKWILGMRIQRDRLAGTITLDQELYVSKALEKFGLSECKTASTPAVSAQETENDEDGAGAPADKEKYMEIVGTLLYATISTRVDISYAVQKLTRHMQAPLKRHMVAAERVMRYLSGLKELGLLFGRIHGVGKQEQQLRDSLQLSVEAFADADWANDKLDRKSITGWVAKVNGDVVSWASKKQRTVAQSTCEAELYAEAAAMNEVLWLRGLLAELKLDVKMPSTIFGDNQSAIALSEHGVKSERTKHVDVKYHFITDEISKGAVQVKWVPSAEQQADIFTKALAAPVFELLRKQIMTR